VRAPRQRVGRGGVALAQLLEHVVVVGLWECGDEQQQHDDAQDGEGDHGGPPAKRLADAAADERAQDGADELRGREEGSWWMARRSAGRQDAGGLPGARRMQTRALRVLRSRPRTRGIRNTPEAVPRCCGGKMSATTAFPIVTVLPMKAPCGGWRRFGS
jgi:hypothetical protein